MPILADTRHWFVQFFWVATRARRTALIAATISAVSFCVAGLALTALVRLPYTQSIIDRVEKEDLCNPPNGANAFRIGDREWDIDQYRASATLEPYRTFLERHALGLKGIDATRSICDAFNSKVTFGNPAREFLYSPDYVPSADFESCLKGGPGHCVTISGHVACILLSSGLPARVVQFISPAGDTGGHTLLEVWDDRVDQWAAFDPAYGGALIIDGKAVSAVEALKRHSDVTIDQSCAAAFSGSPNAFYGARSFSLIGGGLIYPEPWLYMRNGEKTVAWPFQGRFLYYGPPLYQFGPAQTALRYVLTLSIFAAFLAAAISVSSVFVSSVFVNGS